MARRPAVVGPLNGGTVSDCSLQHGLSALTSRRNPRILVGPALADREALARQAELWFKADPRFDQEIKTRFGRDLEAAASSDLDTWKTSPHARLAGIVLLDQFSRNVYRGSARAFAQDKAALALCLEGLTKEEDRQLHPIERLFFYMPLQPAEDAEMQE